MIIINIQACIRNNGNKFLRAEIYLFKNIFGMICDDIISLERKIKREEHFDIIDEGVLVYYIYIMHTK